MEALINSLQGIYSMLGVSHSANIGDLIGVSAILFILAVSLLQLLPWKTAEKPPIKPSLKIAKEVTAEVIEEKIEAPAKIVPEISWTDRLSKGLARSRQEVWGKLGSIITGKSLNDEVIEDLEEILYGADIGPAAVSELIEGLNDKKNNTDFGLPELKAYLHDVLGSKMRPIQEKVDTSLYEFNNKSDGIKVIMVVGVNGAGKTTTIGKLATKLTNQGAKVVVGACDTFRAAAVDQLQVWCERAGAQMVRAKDGANPSGVGFDTLKQAIAEKADYCILDTAGRLHTNENLMEELKKSKRVLEKLNPAAPHQVLLVIDAITGQNALKQANEFHKALNLDGLIFTKCDGSSKAGSAISIVRELQVPIAYIGVGESVEDLNIFNLNDYLKALLDF
jgi:fused signal recognition particle receptor